MAEKIRNIKGIKILNSRGEETIKVKVYSDNYSASFSVPSGKSTGKYEMSSVGADMALLNIENKLLPFLKDREVNFEEIDKLLIAEDDTLKRRVFGANTILAISVALAKIQAKTEQKKLSDFLAQFFKFKLEEKQKLKLLMNFINGGVHSIGGPPIQEYLVIVEGENPSESVYLGAKLYRRLRELINANIGDEGGFVLQTQDPEEPIKILENIIEKEGVSTKVKLGLDVAATQFFKENKYNLAGQEISSQNLEEIYLKLLATHNIIYIEDPFEEDDFMSFVKLKEKVEGCLIVGDDLTVTNPERVEKAIKSNSISGVIIKPNQIGTLSETINAINIAQENEVEVIISHRSGETNDSFIVDLALACNAWGLKAGAPARGERIAKYNKLIEIQQ